MNLYYFNPEGYGPEAFVCAESKEKAIEYLKSAPAGGGHGTPDQEKFSLECHQRMIDYMIAGKIEEHPVGEVVFSEIC